MVLAKKDVNKVKILIEKSTPSLLEQLIFVENPTNKRIITSIFYALKKHSQYNELR